MPVNINIGRCFFIWKETKMKIREGGTFQTIKMNSSRYYEDPLGFTEHTKLLLIGSGNENLVEEMRRRNISKDELPKLTKEDLIVLGCKESNVDKAQKSLNKIIKKSIDSSWKADYKYGIIGLKHMIEVLRDAQNYLTLIKSYIIYYNHILLSGRNKALDNDANDSKALRMASESLIKEFSFVENEFFELKKKIITTEKRKEGNCIKLCVLISALGLTGTFIFYAYKK